MTINYIPRIGNIAQIVSILPIYQQPDKSWKLGQLGTYGIF